MSLQHLEQETFTNETEFVHYSGVDKSSRTAACRCECEIQRLIEGWDKAGMLAEGHAG